MVRAILLTCVAIVYGHAATISEVATGITLSVSPAGGYLISVQDPAWTFAGDAGQPLDDVNVREGVDRIGAYDEVTFGFVGGRRKQGGIRTYRQKPILLFTLSLPEGGDNSGPFPLLSMFPHGLDILTFGVGAFGEYSFWQTTTGGPLIEFDQAANTFILSAASNFMVATTSIGQDQNIGSGVSAEIRSLPAGFTQQTLLVVGKGINQAFETWGHALTDLQGKLRPANDADITLSHLGYWTDNGATYYYHFEPRLGYEDTLLAVRDEFQSKGVPLGYLQLDSWFYPKGANDNWRDGHAGIYEYHAAPDLFPKGLKAFQQQLGIPLVTHARWIDPSSPYRHEYRMSSDVVIDPRYWDKVMSDLHNAGVATYEQDWLSGKAQTDFNLADGDAFLSGMAEAAARNGLTLEYCMPTARHYMQGSKYSNLTTVRTSPDHFDRDRWGRFLYGSRLATALGIWPWSDVFRSRELDNLLLATLSGGPVGVGDPLGAVDAANLLLAVRKDGVIVKPDTPLVPLDRTILEDAQGLQTPMVAATYTDFGDMRPAYVFAYPRGLDTAVSFQPEDLGFEGPVYVYDNVAGAGRPVDSTEIFTATVAGAYAYYIVTPIGKSGIGFLGDAHQLVSLGRRRITQMVDDGVLEVSVAFASGESFRMLHGYSPSAPAVSALEGTAGTPVYDSGTQRFSVRVSGNASAKAVLRIARH